MRSSDPGRSGNVAFKLNGARWLGLVGVAAVAAVLIVLGLRRHPLPAPAQPSQASRPAAESAGGKGAGMTGGTAASGTRPVVAAARPAMMKDAVPPSSAAKPVASPAPPPVPSTDERLANAQRLVQAGEWEQALVVLQKARRENPQSGAAAYQLANLSLEHKRWVEGAQAARIAGERDPKYRSDDRLVKNLIRALGTDNGYEKTEDVLHGFGAGPVPLLKDAAAHDKSPAVRQRAAELLRSRPGSRVNARSPATRKSSSHSFFSR
jgi:hypothetical protein